ncbi:MAG: Kelch repeat-containing protein, partial [Candidatus Hodarchaeales archaeon]
MGTVQIDNKVYLIGGFNNGTSLDSILCFNIVTLSLEQVDSTLPIGVERPEVVEIDQKIYIFSGITFNVGFNDQIFKFDPQTDTIETLDTKMPAKIAGTNTHWTGSEVLFYGGFNGETVEVLDTIWAFDPVTRSFIEKEEKLPFPCMTITELITVDNLLYTSSIRNATGHFNVIYEVNLDTFEFKLIQDDYLSSGRYEYMICHDDLHVFLLGGVPIYVFADNSIIQVDISRLIHEPLLLEPERLNWEISHEEDYWFENNLLSWHTRPIYSKAMKGFKRVTRENDQLDLEIVYYNHSDVNTRQQVNIGWANNVSSTQLNIGQATNCPCSNFIGITMKTSFPKISFTVSIIKEEKYLSIKRYFLEENNIHYIRLQVKIDNSTHFQRKITVDGLVMVNDAVEGNLMGMEFNTFAIWNQLNTISDSDFQGEFQGSLSFARYSENIEVPLKSRNLLIEGLAMFIIIILVFSAYMLFITQTRKYYKHSKGPDEIPSKLIPSTAYKLYCSLDRAFKRLEKISRFYVVNDQPVSDEGGLIEEWKNKEEIHLPDFDFSQLSGTSLEIMIYLLDYLDHGTYSSVIKEDLELNRSTVAYNIHVLESKGLIIKMDPHPEKDQRMKLISLTATGRGLLYQIYKKLENYFS